MGPGLEWSELSALAGLREDVRYNEEWKDILKAILNENVSTDSDGGVDEL